MPLSKNLSTYDDVRAVLEAALRGKLPKEYELPSPAAATSWRQRASYFRKHSHNDGYAGLVFRIEKERPSVVIIDVRPAGVLREADGTEVPITPVKTQEELEAEELARELGILR